MRLFHKGTNTHKLYVFLRAKKVSLSATRDRNSIQDYLKNTEETRTLEMEWR